MSQTRLWEGTSSGQRNRQPGRRGGTGTDMEGRRSWRSERARRVAGERFREIGVVSVLGFSRRSR